MKNFNKKAIIFCVFSFFNFSLASCVPIDLDKISQDFVIDRFKVNIPGYPQAYNPSIIRWKDSILLSFRVLTDPKNLWQSHIGLVWLDEDFVPIGKPQLLNTRWHKPSITSRSEDARIFLINEKLFVIYNDNEEEKDGCVRRMYIAEITYDGKKFKTKIPECIHSYEGERKDRWEKNWIPFEYKNQLLLAYGISPHRILMPFIDKGICATICSTVSNLDWKWGKNRIYGGTPAIKINDEYLAFFHSSMQLTTTQSGKDKIWHYFMGAYTFNAEPPFNITKVSPQAILGKGMYSEPLLWKRVIFPGGFIYDEKYIWIAYGRDDQETWILKLNKKGLYKSLIPVFSNPLNN